jgi:metal-responsive CopG/Arc/MetJ family transcriptional regulator
MKTAVSIPDGLFGRAERLAKKMKLTRSGLFSAALDEYVARHGDDEVTEAVNAALLSLGDQPDPFLRPFLREAARRTLERTEW